MFKYHPHPRGYPCAKFRFRRAPTAELARGEKSCTTQSPTQSLNHYTDTMQDFLSVPVYLSANELTYL